MPRIACINGTFMPLENATVSVMDRGFLFGDGIYEVTAVLDGRLVDYAAHAARLARSLGEIGLACPVDAAALHGLHLEMIARNHLQEGVLYLQISRGPAERDFIFPDNPAPTLVMFCQHKKLAESPLAAVGMKILSVPDQRWARCDIKSTAMLAQVLAKQAAHAAGCHEAWMLRDGFVTEGGSSTAFIITRDGRLVTRPLSSAVLPGITRVAVMALLAASGLVLEERAFTLAEAYAASEAFNTSAGGFVMPVVEIDGNMIGTGQPGPHAMALRAAYLAAARREGARQANAL